MKDLKIFAKTIDPKAQAQIDLLLAQEPFKDCKVRIMPDVHAGVGCVIGFTADLGDKVIPNIVGVDIGCGMLTTYLGQVDINYNQLDDIIRKHVPSGRNVHKTVAWGSLIGGLRCSGRLYGLERLHASMGTLGGGNHFIEIDEDAVGGKYLIIHTGSRNLGKQVANIYQDVAVQNLRPTKEEVAAVVNCLKAEGREREINEALAELKRARTIPRDLCYVEGVDREDYLHDMKLCQRFATLNRERIADTILCGLDLKPAYSFHTVHNYIDDYGMVRKGAISAHAWERVLIPINMRDGCILGTGRGNKDWNESAPHGAGRLMSRAEARKTISVEDYHSTMTGIHSSCVGGATLDEAPQAYKPMEEILECIKPTVDVDLILKPVYNFKASE